MINQKLRRQVLYSTLAAMWVGSMKTVSAAEGDSSGDVTNGAATGIFGGLQTTDLLVCMLIAICIILLLLIIMTYTNAQKSASEKKVNFLEKKIERMESELQDLCGAVQQGQQQMDDKIGIIGAGIQAKAEARRQELPVTNEGRAYSEMVGTNQKAEMLRDTPRQSSIGMFLNEYSTLSSNNTVGYEVKKARTDFIAKYKIKAFSCANFNERVYQLNLDPIFRDVVSPLSGDYWAVKFSREDAYYVVPNPKGTYEAQLHSTGGMKEAFSSNYQGGSYEHVEVLQTAEFSCMNGCWNILKPGKIRLS